MAENITGQDPQQEATQTQAQTINNDGTIHEQHNTQNNYYNTVGSEKAEKEPDPTEELPIQFGKWYPDENEIKECTQLLFKNNLLVISCTDNDALECLTYSLAENNEFSDLDKRLLWINDTQSVANRKNNDNSTDVEKIVKTLKKDIQSFDDLLRKDIKQNTFLVIDIDSQIFLDTFLVWTDKIAKKYQEQFSRRELFILCRVDSDELIQHIHKQKVAFFFPYEVISRLRFMLRQKGFDEKETLFYEESLLQQRLKNLWNINVKDKEFLDTIYQFLSESKVKFLQEFSERQSFINKSDEEIYNFLKNRVGKIHPADFITQDKSLSMHLAFVATYFPTLTVREFQDIVYVLLSDDNKVIKENIKKETIREDKSIEIQDEIITTKCLDIWISNKDSLLKKTNLKLVKTDSKTEGVDFSEPYLREEVQEFLEQKFPFYFQEQVDFLFGSGILFNEDVSDNVANHLLKLFARMAQKDPQIYGLKRLKDITELINQVDYTIDDEAEGYALMVEVFKKLRADGFRGLAYFRLYQLIGEFLSNNLNKIVEEYINYLFEETQHDIVLSIIIHLRNTPSFNKFYWIKQMFDRGQAEEKTKTYKLVVELASKAILGQVPEYLQEVKKWLPETERLPENYSRSNIFALAFIIDYSVKTINEFPNEEYGQWTPSYPLFSVMSEEELKSTEGWNNLMTWLLDTRIHRGSSEWITINYPATDNDQNAIIAIILEWWYSILHGWEDSVNSDNNKAIYAMINSIRQIAGEKRLKNIMLHLGLLTDNYLEKFTETSVYDKKGREYLKKRRLLTKKMINTIREILKTNIK
jgi:hypothetical protein